MKRTLSIIGVLSLSTHVFADSITDGIAIAGDSIYSYTPYVQMLGFVLASIIGVVGAFAVYYAIINNDVNVKKKILTWGGSCVTMLCMTIALPNFFDFQESGIASSGNGSLGDYTGHFVGGDRWGKINTSIPDLSDPVWKLDDRYIRRNNYTGI